MFYNLLRGLWLNGVEFDLVLSDADRLNDAFRSELTEVMKRRIVVCGGPGRRFIAEQKSCFNPDLSSEAFLFPNYFTPPLVSRRFGRVVTVIHDFLYRHYPQYAKPRKRLWLRFAHQLTFHRADAVVVLSESVRQDAIRFFGNRARRKLVVIPNPISWDRLEDCGADRSDGRPYILTVTAHYPHKNLETLLSAFALVRSRLGDIDLVIAGQRRSKLLGTLAGGGDLEQHVDHLGLNGSVRFAGHVGDRELASLYRNAVLFAFPSLFEGFGMPPVEALGLGLPTLTTRCASLPEVTLNKAIYVDRPRDIEEWAERMLAMLEHRSDFEVSPQTVTAIRERYAPERIGRLYADVLLEKGLPR